MKTNAIKMGTIATLVVPLVPIIMVAPKEAKEVKTKTQSVKNI